MLAGFFEQFPVNDSDYGHVISDYIVSRLHSRVKRRKQNDFQLLDFEMP